MPEASLSGSRFPVFQHKKQGQEQGQGQGPIVEGERVRSLSPLSAGCVVWVCPVCLHECFCVCAVCCVCVYTPLFLLHCMGYRAVKAQTQGLVFKPFSIILALKGHALEWQGG